MPPLWVHWYPIRAAQPPKFTSAHRTAAGDGGQLTTKGAAELQGQSPGGL